MASDKKILLVGGRYSPNGGTFGNLYNEVWSTTDGTDWILLTNNPGWIPRYGHTTLYFNDIFWLFGGLTPIPTADIYYSNDGGLTWKSQGGGGKWPARAFASAAVFNGRIWLMGGTNLRTSYHDIWSSTDGNLWTDLIAPWSPRDSFSLIVSENVLWVLGGRLPATSSFSSSSSSVDDNAKLSRELTSSEESFTVNKNNNTVTFSSEIWRSDTTGKLWELVEDNTVWGNRASMGTVVVVLPPMEYSVSANPLSTIFILGGMTETLTQTKKNNHNDGSSGGSTLFSSSAVSITNDIWLSTPNLYCENASIVCSGHGTCTPSSTGSSLFSSTGGVVPLPINCSCDVGYMSSRCEERVCNSRTCVHGTCTPSNLTMMGASSSLTAGPDTCICTNPYLWTGPQCNIPICSPGCDPVHGSCTNQPGTCNCAENWDGPQCTIEIDWLASVGKYVTTNAEPIFITCTSIGILGAFIFVFYINYSIVKKGSGSLNKKGYTNYGSSNNNYNALPTNRVQGTTAFINIPGLSSTSGSSSGTSSDDDYLRFNKQNNLTSSSAFNDPNQDLSSLYPLTMTRSRHGAALAFAPTTTNGSVGGSSSGYGNRGNDGSSGNGGNKIMENNNALLANRSNPTNNPTSILANHHTTLSTKHSRVSQRLFNVTPPGIQIIGGKEKKKVRFGGAEISEFVPQSIPTISPSSYSNTVSTSPSSSSSSSSSLTTVNSPRSTPARSMDSLRFQQAFSDSEGEA